MNKADFIALANETITTFEQWADYYAETNNESGFEYALKTVHDTARLRDEVSSISHKQFKSFYAHYYGNRDLRKFATPNPPQLTHKAIALF